MFGFRRQKIFFSAGLRPQDLVNCVYLGTESDKKISPHEKWGVELRNHAHKMHYFFPPNAYRQCTYSYCFINRSLWCLCRWWLRGTKEVLLYRSWLDKSLYRPWLMADFSNHSPRKVWGMGTSLRCAPPTTWRQYNVGFIFSNEQRKDLWLYNLSGWPTSSAWVLTGGARTSESGAGSVGDMSIDRGPMDSQTATPALGTGGPSPEPSGLGMATWAHMWPWWLSMSGHSRSRRFWPIKNGSLTSVQMCRGWTRVISLKVSSGKLGDGWPVLCVTGYTDITIFHL